MGVPGQKRSSVHPLVRFMRHVEPVGECLVWTGSTSGSGTKRGYFRPGTRSSDQKVIAYRWLYEFLIGPIPEGYELDHRKDLGCVGRMCVKPAHLEPVTPRENKRREADYRVTCISGRHAWVEENIHFNGGSNTCKACRAESYTRAGKSTVHLRSA